MATCVRLANDIVAEFGNVYDSVEFVAMLGLDATTVEPVARSVEPQVSAFAFESSSHNGVATAANLAELQTATDEAAAAGCRAI